MSYTSLLESARYVHALLPSTDNAGNSDDERDLYYLADYLAFAVARRLPEHPCREGCDACCRTVPFTITRLEWQRIETFLGSDPQRYRGQESSSPADCPFLREGSCEIYPVRPLVCRCYGYCSVGRDEQITLLMCPSAGEALMREIGEEGGFPLPRWGAFHDRMLVLNSLAGFDDSRSLSQWLRASR